MVALPGEHGLHARDGSLMKKKREQWQREKSESSSWFPFGTDRKRSATGTAPAGEISNGNGHANGVRVDSPGSTSAYYSNSFASANSQQSAAYSGRSSQFVMQTPFIGGPTYPMTPIPFYPPQFMTPQPGIPYPIGPPISQTYEHFAGSSAGQSTSNCNPQSVVPLVSQLPSMSQAYSTQPFSGQLPVWQPPIPQIPASPMVTVPGAIHGPMVAPIAALMASTPLVTYSTTTTTATTALQAVLADQPQQLPTNGYRTTIAIGSSVDVITPPPQPQLQVQQTTSTSDGRSTTKRSSIDLQIEERRRREEELAEQERRELESIRREQEAQARQREREEAEKAERQRQMEKEMDAHQRAYQLNMERAQVESEALRKARLHKHRLLDAEASHETVCQILGTNDEELIRRVLKELNELERQRRIDYENLNLSHGASTTAGPYNDSHYQQNSSGSARRPANGASTPLTRNTRGRASLRAPSKSSDVRPPRRSDSAERAGPTPPPRGAVFPRPSTSGAGSAPTTPLAQRKFATAPQPKPRSRLGQPSAFDLPQSLPSKTRLGTTMTPSDITVASGSTMSVCSSKTTILAGDSPFAVQLPRVRSPKNKYGGSPRRESHCVKTSETAIEPVSIIVNRSLPLASDHDACLPSTKNQQHQELFSSRRLTPFDGLKQYEAIAANFHAVQRATATSQISTSFRTKAVQHLVDLKTSPKLPPSTSLKSDGPQTGLFEPVRTRNKVMRSIKTPYAAESASIDKFYDGPSYDRLEYRLGSRADETCKPPALSSMGASTNQTPSDSSLVSTSPPLSNDCKSTSSSVENHGLDADDERGRTKPPNGPRFGSWRHGDASGSSEKLSDTTSGASSIGRPTGNESFVPSTRRGGYATPRFGAAVAGQRSPVTLFAQKLADSGLRRHPTDHPETLRRNLQSPTMKHLQESLGNLSAVGNSPPATNESASRSTTPKPFNCDSMRYRSLNLKHRSHDHNQPMLAKLADLRAQLKVRQSAIREQVVRGTDV